MHDLDRTLLETEYEEEYYGQELESEYESDGAGELDELDAANELLDVQSEEELEEFLGDIVKTVTRAAGSALGSGAGKALTGVLKDAARKAVPSIGRAIGSRFGAGDVGERVAQRAGSMLGLELEGLSPQDQELETARQFVRFARAAASEAARNPQADPRRAAQRAAEQYAPGLVRTIGRPRGGRQNGGMRQNGGPDVQTLQAMFANKDQASPLSETEEMELAGELLEVASEEELEEFLGDIVKKVGRTIGKVVRSPIGRQIGGILKGVAKKALPVVGGAVGSFFAPGAGTAIGTSLGSAAANMFELELEGMDQEDQEFEVAKRVVQLTAAAAKNAADAPRGVPAAKVAQAAVGAAAQRYAPGLARSDGDRGGRAMSGRWARRGRKIVLYNV
jgi:uncharacterized protein (DUF697 family)